MAGDGCSAPWLFLLSFSFIGAVLLPESPRWLVANGRSERARGILAHIGGYKYADEELLDIQGTIASTGASKWQDLLRPHVFRIVMIGVVLAALQQWVGINVMFNYAEEIYRSAGYGVSDTLLNIVATGAIALVSTLAAFPLVDGWEDDRSCCLVAPVSACFTSLSG